MLNGERNLLSFYMLACHCYTSYDEELSVLCVWRTLL